MLAVSISRFVAGLIKCLMNTYVSGLIFRQWVLATFKLWDGELDFIEELLEDDVRLVPKSCTPNFIILVSTYR